MSRKPIVAIDGPAGAGKSTVARAVAERLGYIYIDTGAMYRAVALKVLDSQVPLAQTSKITSLAKKLDIRLTRVDGEQRVILDGDDVSERIRGPEASRMSSPVSAIHGVRKRMVELQRALGEAGGVVMEGRDIGTVVFPDAEVKVFLTASTAERARRRVQQLRDQGVDMDPEQVEAEIKERDLRDSTRQHAPLKQAPDAVLVDTDAMTVEQVIDAIVGICCEKADGECCTS